MKDFEYFAPGTVKEALALLSRYRERSKVIAGGQSLLVRMRRGSVSPEFLVDIRGVPSLDYLKSDTEGGLKIGALCTHGAIENSEVVRDRFGALSDMEQNLASVQTRNWGTIGGNLCEANPAADPAPVLIALNARLKIARLNSQRTVPVEKFFTGPFKTVLEPDELLTGIHLPDPLPRTGTAYTKFTRREGDMAVVGTAVSITLGPGNGTCRAARIALGAVGRVPVRARRAEEVLVGNQISDELFEQAARAAAGEAAPVSDVQASAEYRRELVRVLVRRVVKEAWQKSGAATRLKEPRS